MMCGVWCMVCVVMQDMGDKHRETCEVRGLYEKELAQLSDLQARFTILEAEYNALMEERRLEVLISFLPRFLVDFTVLVLYLLGLYLYVFQRERKEKADEELTLITSAVCVMQRAWRAYKARKVPMRGQTETKTEAKKAKKKKKDKMCRSS